MGEQSVALTEIWRSTLWLLFPGPEELKGIRKTKKEASDPDRGYSMQNTNPEKPFPIIPVCHCAKATTLPKSSSDTREEGPGSLSLQPQLQKT